MPKTNRQVRAARAEAARIKAAEARAAAKRAERRRQVIIASISVAVVLVVLAVIVVIGLTHKSKNNAGGAALAPASVVTGVTKVSGSTFDKVGAGASQQTVPKALKGAPPLTSGGKPEVLYIGAEYCPHCAAERWPLAVALSRFGSFDGLGVTKSSSLDVPASVPTLTFHGATYTSKYLTFVGKEHQSNKVVGNNYATLDKLTSQEQTLFTKYGGSSYPFVDLGNKWTVGQQFDPAMLTGKSQTEIAQALNDPSTPLAKAIDGAANTMTAAICRLTNNQPTNVCTSSGVTAAAGRLASG